MCFEMKNTLKSNLYHILKHSLVGEKKHYYNK